MPWADGLGRHTDRLFGQSQEGVKNIFFLDYPKCSLVFAHKVLIFTYFCYFIGILVHFYQVLKLLPKNYLSPFVRTAYKKLF